MADRCAVYPGSFDPPTNGHVDLIERAAKIFDTLVIAVAWNSEKSGLFTPDERVEMLKEVTAHVPNLQYVNFQGLTVDLAKQHQAVAIIRGLRAVSDFEYEMTMAGTNRRMYPDCDTISFMPSEEYIFISSRLVKEIATLGGNVSQFVPEYVEQRLKEKLGR
jgi:pantetheine-phosphate adenylyltransferase